MPRHIERALGFEEAEPDLDELSIQEGEDPLLEGYEVEEEPEEFASNTDMLDIEAENPLDSYELMSEGGLGLPGEAPQTLAGPSDEDPFAMEMAAPGGADYQGPGELGEEDPVAGEFEGEDTPELRKALTDRFIQKARERYLNSVRFQDRALLLNKGSEEDDNAGL